MKSSLKAGMALGCAMIAGAGCKNIENIVDSIRYDAYAVVVGMENSKFAGKCDGSGYDAERMNTLIKKYADHVTCLRDAQATKAAVTMALNDAVKKADKGLVIFYYSGHGGSEPFADTGMEEEDGSDEFLCLYDTYMRDNEIWSIISKSKGRIWLVCDCCHSRTMFRNSVVKINPPLAFDYKLNEKHGFSMLCWSGCPDDTYSYGASTGGQFTNALLRHLKDGKTYKSLWNDIKNDKTLRAYENPQSTVLGDGFDDKEIFR